MISTSKSKFFLEWVDCDTACTIRTILARWRVHELQQLFMLVAMMIVCSGDVFAQRSVYRCAQNGVVTYSDQSCPGGEVREGNNWISVDELNRRRKAEAERARVAELDRQNKEKAMNQARASTRQHEGAIVANREMSLTSSPSPVAIDRMTTYSVVLGRAIGCGINVDAQLKRVGIWFDAEFPVNGNKAIFMGIMAEGMKKNAQLQRSGNSPDSCESIRRQINEFPWP